MNHFMLPVAASGSGSWMSMATRYGSAAMEYLINEMLKLGARKDALEMKLVGGGKIIRNMSDVGQRNIDFVLNYAELEGLRIVAQDLGDIYPRKVIFHPNSGRMRVKRLRTMHNETLMQREQHYVEELQSQTESGEVELFQMESQP
jgi:chemotaxis protein CheD